ncbi:hypothetical protein JCM10914A_34870 [Paenibacillus sp. JCM 10914]|uniref:DUF2304 domain-containing protein n=1 Tax=Paenibacillus sp. JCM 10914 TaxID=1236974 RepID=UPI0003CC68A9|nr:DUF2304 domain-containing protein [Paenibacillus sp. JCM 10914]GAE04125.1 hypothetical protein JCM10914_154 [Paenibacillus sp. JCM 10914]
MMNIYVLSILFSLAFLLIILELVRRRKLKEQYSLLWILMGVLLLIISMNVSLVEQLADWLRIEYAPALLFLFGLLFCFVFILHLTIVITKLSQQVLRLTQEITILKGDELKHHERDH